MRSRYDTRVEPRLKEIEAWCRDGVSEEQIAKNLGVAYSTFRSYKEKYPALSAVLTRTRAYVDQVVVTGAFLQRAIGYTAVERKRIYEYKTDETTGRREKRLVSEVETEKHVPADPRLLELWLKTRLYETWGRNHDHDLDLRDEHPVTFLPARDFLEEPEEEEVMEDGDGLEAST